MDNATVEINHQGGKINFPVHGVFKPNEGTELMFQKSSANDVKLCYQNTIRQQTLISLFIQLNRNGTAQFNQSRRANAMLLEHTDNISHKQSLPAKRSFYRKSTGSDVMGDDG